MSATPVRADGKSGVVNGISPIPDPPIRTLKVELLSHNSTKYIPVIANGREPTPFETEFFKGNAQIVIRTTPIDKNFECFFVGRRRLFEVQVQGKFKREPAGEIYVGAEASCKMEMGLITRSISLAAMKLCSTMVNDMHYSFGDSLDNPNHQLPHVVGPIFPTMDKVIVTPPGETPPRLGIPFTENLEYRKERLKYKTIEEAQVKLDHTYSFSVNTSNLNLLEWTMVNIPMVKPMDLRTFFGSASIQLVGYEMPRSVAAKFPNSHPKKLMNYVFNMKLTPVEPDALPILDLPTLESEDETGNEEDETGTGKPLGGEDVDTLTSPLHETTDMVSETEEEEEEGQFDEKIVKNLENSFAKERDLPTSARTMSSASGMNSLLAQQRKVIVERTTVGSWLRKKFARINRSSAASTTTSARKNLSSAAADDFEEGEVNESTEMSESMDWECENVTDLTFCPGCIELNDSKRDGRGKFSYFLALHPALEVTPNTAYSNVHPDYHPNAPRIKSYSEIAKILPLVPLPKLPKNRRLSPLEKRRRQIVESYRQVIKDPSSPAFKKFQSSMVNITDTERNFLQSSSHFVNERRNTRDGLTSWESAVALVLSRRHYLEQSMVLTVTDLIFRRSSESKRNQIHIPLDQILSVQPLPVEQCPMPPFGCLQIETFARVFCVLLYSDTLVNEWIPLFSRAMGRDCMISPHRLQMDPMNTSSALSASEIVNTIPDNSNNDNGTVSAVSAALAVSNTNNLAASVGLGRPSGHSRSATITNDSFTDREEFFLARPACWKLDKRRVFNYRRVHFKPVLSNNVSPTATGTTGTSVGTSARHPCDLVASLLSAAFYLSHVLNSEQSRVTDSDWIRFWDELSLLQTISLVNLTEPEKMAFFLNLYHVMVVHGSMVYGPPPAWNHWNAFYNQITYLVAGELVSIAEIEYCILKANMSRSYMFTSVAMPAPPTSSFPHLALKSRDFRLHFAINCGSLSNLDVVPIYTPELLDSQLDLVTRLSLEIALEVDLAKRTVTMPRLPMIDYQSVSDQIFFPSPTATTTSSSMSTTSNMNNNSTVAGITGNNSNNNASVGTVNNNSKGATISPLPVSNHTSNTNNNSNVNTSNVSTCNNNTINNNSNGVSTTLPEADMALASASSASNSSNNLSVIEATLNCLYALLPYVSKSLRAQLRVLLQDGKNLTLRYRPYNFRCCMLGKLTAYRSSPLSSNASSQLQQDNVNYNTNNCSNNNKNNNDANT